MIIRAFFILIFFLAATVSAADFFGGGKERAGGTSAHALGATAGMETPPDPFYAISLEARAVYVFDARTGAVLYEKDAELQLPLASLTKVMLVLIVREVAPADAIVTVSSKALAAEGDSGLLLNEKWELSSLADFTLLTSSNDGARALASAGAALVNDREGAGPKSFVDLMNEKARALGMEQSFFMNETGLDEGHGVSGAYGSAKDVAKLFAYALRTHPELFSATARDEAIISSLDATHTATNTNVIVKKIPGLIASKTGFTDLAGGNLAIAFEAGPVRPIIVVVLGSTAEGRFTDVERLTKAATEAIALQN